VSGLNEFPWISENVMILTRDELRARLAREFERGVRSALPDRVELFERAALPDHGIGVVFSSDGTARIQVSDSLDNNLGDCLAVRWLNEGTRDWYTMHVSPARARLIALELNHRATLVEERYPDSKKVDPLPERYRKGSIGVDTLPPIR